MERVREGKTRKEGKTKGGEGKRERGRGRKRGKGESGKGPRERGYSAVTNFP